MLPPELHCAARLITVLIAVLIAVLCAWHGQAAAACSLQITSRHYDTTDGVVTVIAGPPARTVRLWLDTGTPDSTIDRTFLQRAGSVAVEGSIGTLKAGRGPVPRALVDIDLGPDGNVSLLYPRLADLGLTARSRQVDVILGMSALGGCMIDFDPVRRTISIGARLSPARLPDRVLLQPGPGQGLAFAKLTLPGGTVVPVVVDPFGPVELSIPEPAWQSLRRLAPTPVATDMIAWTRENFERVGLIYMSGVHLGAASLGGANTLLLPLHGRHQVARVGFGLLGCAPFQFDLLHHVLAFDHRKLCKPGRLTRAGVMTTTLSDRLWVGHVMAGSPAQRHGIHKGDQICHIDSRPIGEGYRRSLLSGWARGAPGRTVALGMCDGRLIELTLQEFY